MRNLKTPSSFLVVLGLLAAVAAPVATAPVAHAFGLGGGTKADVKSTQEIRDLYADFVKAWNKHDVKAMSERWAVDGDQMEPDGTRAMGRDEVTELLTKQHEGVFKNTKLALTVKTVWMISDNVALVDGNYELEGATLPDGTAIPPRKGYLTAVLIQERNTWAIAASRLMIPTELPYKSRQGVSQSDAAAPKQP
jgi:uncharacterized protein (TIGR02246 family)